MNHARRPYWRSFRTYWYWFAFALLLIFQWMILPPAPPPPGPDVMPEGMYEVERAVDGDTLKMKSGARVRLEGVNTPETVRENYPVEPWGPEASQYTKDFLRDANYRVRLTYGNERVDDYGRFLAFVWNGERLLNEELVREGLAYAYLRGQYSNELKRRLRIALDEAKREQRGIWSNPVPKPARPVPITR